MDKIFNLSALDFYSIDSFEIYRDGIVGYRESKYKIASHSEKFYKLSKITKFNLNCTIALFYSLVLVLLNWNFIKYLVLEH